MVGCEILFRCNHMLESDGLPAENRANVPAHRTPAAPLAIVRPGNHLVSRMAKDVLKSLPSLVEKRWRVGEFEVCEQSYRQIMIWLDRMKSNGITISLDDFVDLQANTLRVHVRYSFDDIYADERWIVDGKIVRAYFSNDPRLIFENPRTELDLSSIPSLILLWCDGNQLAEIDLSNVPCLTLLQCDDNQLTELNLASVPKLTALWCQSTGLTELDLSGVPSLTLLACSGNRLTGLDLSSVPRLIMLRCVGNQLTELNLSSVPSLKELVCSHNQLTELNLFDLPSLTSLDCRANELTVLDIRHCPNLNSVQCDKGVLVHKRPDQTVVHR
jgi:hypothetical protein